MRVISVHACATTKDYYKRPLPRRGSETMKTTIHDTDEWSGSLDSCDPDNYWIDDDTSERVSAVTGERTKHDCPLLDADGSLLNDDWTTEETIDQ